MNGSDDSALLRSPTLSESLTPKGVNGAEMLGHRGGVIVYHLPDD